ncbi:hypothetical protein PC123_g13707 [Phytophthora cactorum]|nr:hypothetical protein PC123_g13707 [Phytophthora cactorum]
MQHGVASLNCKNQVIKRVALTMLYLAQGGTKDQAATVMGTSRPRAVVYINETLDVLSTMTKRFIVMPSADELPLVEDGFFATAGFPIRSAQVTARRSASHDLMILRAGTAVKKSLQSTYKL